MCGPGESSSFPVYRRCLQTQAPVEDLQLLLEHLGDLNLPVGNLGSGTISRWPGSLGPVLVYFIDRIR